MQSQIKAKTWSGLTKYPLLFPLNSQPRVFFLYNHPLLEKKIDVKSIKRKE